MSKRSYSPANRIIANVLMGVWAIGMGLYYGWGWLGWIIGGVALAFAAFQFFVVDRADNYEGYSDE